METGKVRFLEAAKEIGQLAGRTSEEIVDENLRRLREFKYPTSECIPADLSQEEFRALEENEHIRGCDGCQATIAQAAVTFGECS